MDTQSELVNLAAETRFNGVSAILVVDRLVLAAPSDLSAEEKKALKAMQAARKEVERVREERATQQPARVRPYMTRLSAVWTGISDMLAATAGLPAEVAGAKADRAQKMREMLFPEAGVPVLNVDAGTAYVEASERLDRIARGDHGRELGALIGAEHVEAARKVTRDLGEVLGVGSHARSIPSSTALSDALREVTQCVARYARKMLASLDESDAESVLRFQRALGPLADHKASLGRGTSADDTTEGGDTTTNGPAVIDQAAPAAPAAPSPGIDG